MVIYCEGVLNIDHDFLKTQLNKNKIEITYYLTLASHSYLPLLN